MFVFGEGVERQSLILRSISRLTRMTLSRLREHLPVLREWFPRPIVQEWSVEECQRSARDLDRRLLAALDRWAGKVSDRLDEDDDIPFR
jgi:hypothetical protein